MSLSNRDHAEMVVAYGMQYGKTHEQIVDMLDADGMLMPDLPEPDNAYPEWSFENLSISPGPDAGEVAIEWEDREDTGRGTMARSLYLAPDQVLALLAAAEQVRAALKAMEEA